MLDPAIIDAMVSSGCSVETLAAAVKAAAIIDKEKVLERRHYDTMRQRAWRKKQKDERNQQERHCDLPLQTVTPPSLLSSPLSSPPKKKEPKKNNPPYNPPTNHPIPESYFVQFWEDYPRKQAKQAALRAFERAVKSGIDPETIIAGCQEFEFSDDPQFIPLPASWLNGHRWDDQPLPQATLTAEPLTQAQLNRKMFDDFARNGTLPGDSRPSFSHAGGKTESLRPLGEPITELIPPDPNPDHSRVHGSYGRANGRLL